MLSLVSDARKKALADHLGQILGRSIQLDVREPSAAAPSSETRHTSPEQEQPGNAPSGSRAQAMELPLVRELLEQFPNASLTHVEQRSGNESSNPSTDADDATS